MSPKLTDEMRNALSQNPGRPLTVEDDQTQQVYVIVDQETHERAMKALQQEEDVAAIRAGWDAAAEGRVSPLAEVDARIRNELGFPPRQ